jgi:hypothetical protein
MEFEGSHSKLLDHMAFDHNFRFVKDASRWNNFGGYFQLSPILKKCAKSLSLNFSILNVSNYVLKAEKNE